MDYELAAKGVLSAVDVHRHARAGFPRTDVSEATASDDAGVSAEAPRPASAPGPKLQRVLVGHSLGSACAALEAINDPQDVRTRTKPRGPAGTGVGCCRACWAGPGLSHDGCVWSSWVVVAATHAGVCPRLGLASGHRFRRRRHRAVAGADPAAGGQVDGEAKDPPPPLGPPAAAMQQLHPHSTRTCKATTPAASPVSPQDGTSLTRAKNEEGLHRTNSADSCGNSSSSLTSSSGGDAVTGDAAAAAVVTMTSNQEVLSDAATTTAPSAAADVLAVSGGGAGAATGAQEASACAKAPESPSSTQAATGAAQQSAKLIAGSKVRQIRNGRNGLVCRCGSGRDCTGWK